MGEITIYSHGGCDAFCQGGRLFLLTAVLCGPPLALIAFTLAAIARRRPGMIWPAGVAPLFQAGFAFQLGNLVLVGWITMLGLSIAPLELFADWRGYFLMGSTLGSASAVPAWLAIKARVSPLVPERLTLR